MSREIRRTKQVQQDIIDIYTYIGLRNSDAAERVVDAIERSIDGLKDFPGIGSVWSASDPRLSGMRVVPVSPYRNYLVFFRPIENRVDIYRVVHGARKLDRIVDEIDFEFE